MGPNLHSNLVLIGANDHRPTPLAIRDMNSSADTLTEANPPNMNPVTESLAGDEPVVIAMDSYSSPELTPTVPLRRQLWRFSLGDSDLDDPEAGHDYWEDDSANLSDAGVDSQTDTVHNSHDTDQPEVATLDQSEVIPPLGPVGVDLFRRADMDHAVIQTTAYTRGRQHVTEEADAPWLQNRGLTTDEHAVLSETFVIVPSDEDEPVSPETDALFVDDFVVIATTDDHFHTAGRGRVPNYQLARRISHDDRGMRNGLFDDHDDLRRQFHGFPDKPLVLHAAMANDDAGVIAAHYTGDWTFGAQVVKISSPCYVAFHDEKRVLLVGDRCIPYAIPDKYVFIYDGRTISLVIREQLLEARIRGHALDRRLALNRDSIPLSTALAVWGQRYGALPLSCRNEVEAVWRSMLYLADEVYRRETLRPPTTSLDSAGLENLAVRLHRRRIDYHGRIMYRSSGHNGVVLEGELVSVELIKLPHTCMRIRALIRIPNEFARFHEVCIRHSLDEFRRFGWYFSNHGDDPAGTYYGAGIPLLREWVPGKIIYQQPTTQGPLSFVVTYDNIVNVHVDENCLHSRLWSHHGCSRPWPVRRHWPLTSLLSLFRESNTKSGNQQHQLSTLVHRVFQLEVDRLALLKAQGGEQVDCAQFTHHCFAVEMFRRLVVHDKTTVKMKAAIPRRLHANCVGTLYDVIPRVNDDVFSLECYFLYWSPAEQTTFGLKIEALEWCHLEPFVDFEASELSPDDGTEQPPFWDPRTVEKFDHQWQTVPLPTTPPTSDDPPRRPCHLSTSGLASLLRPLARALEADCFPANADNAVVLARQHQHKYIQSTWDKASTLMILQILAQFQARTETDFVGPALRRVDLYNRVCASVDVREWDKIRRQREAWLLSGKFEWTDILLFFLLEVVVGWILAQHDKGHMLPGPDNGINWNYTLAPTMDGQTLSNLVAVLQAFTEVTRCEDMVDELVPAIKQLDIDPPSVSYMDEWSGYFFLVTAGKRVPTPVPAEGPASEAAPTSVSSAASASVSASMSSETAPEATDTSGRPANLPAGVLPPDWLPVPSPYTD
ncbi:hypothetical protein PV04_10338 [Phialophora macrospora]|uniref:Uncharacterized protein n=1 Tax=Phialophora macrospora TaxID=1851006 RepID=A0A0D2DMG1_9EURO|nr:hypothetical protein PV04_10338 [Phialophora macrospora]